MRRLRPTDGTPSHRRAAQYHVAQCRTVDQTAHKQLASEMEGLRTKLVQCERAAVDGDDALTAATAVADACELALENTIRDLDGELARLDRNDPTLNARAAVFPNGFGEAIDPENEEQLEVLPALHRALGPLRAIQSVKEYAKRLESDEAKLRAALKDVETAEKNADALFDAEVAARRDIREQMEVAYGRLRVLYKSRPAEAERFFLREGNRRSAPRTPVNVAPAAPGDAKPAKPATGG